MKDLTEILEQHLPKDVWLYTEVPHKLVAAIVAWAENCVPEKEELELPETGSLLSKELVERNRARGISNKTIDQTLKNIRGGK